MPAPAAPVSTPRSLLSPVQVASSRRRGPSLNRRIPIRSLEPSPTTELVRCRAASRPLATVETRAGNAMPPAAARVSSPRSAGCRCSEARSTLPPALFAARGEAPRVGSTVGLSVSPHAAPWLLLSARPEGGAFFAVAAALASKRRHRGQRRRPAEAPLGRLVSANLRVRVEGLSRGSGLSSAES